MPLLSPLMSGVQGACLVNKRNWRQGPILRILWVSAAGYADSPATCEVRLLQSE